MKLRPGKLFVFIALLVVVHACKKQKMADGLCDCAASPSQLKIDSVSLFVPQIITPNGDGVNDVWFIHNIYKFRDVEITIYKKGFLTKKKVFGVFLGSGGNCLWDGKDLGTAKPCPEGKYSFELTINGYKTKGFICLVYTGATLKSRDCIKKCTGSEPLKRDPELE